MTESTAIDHRTVWQNCLAFIKDNVPPNTYNMWFAPIEPVSLKDNCLTVALPSHACFEWLERSAQKVIRTAIRKELGATGRLKYKVPVAEPTDKKPITVTLPWNPVTHVQNPPRMPRNPYETAGEGLNPDLLPGIKAVNIPSNLVESLNFDNFVEGKCNQFARLAGKAIAQAVPGSTPYNPFFIYSDTGLGKTHLAHAIGLELKANYPDAIVLYVSSDLFLQQFTEARRSNNYNDFVYFYQNVDVLIIDDIQFLGGKDKTQEAFFHIFNYLQQHKKQIIITADKSPAEIKGFEARVLARLKWSLVAELTAPDLDTRIAILNKKLENSGIEFPNEVIEYLALRVTANVRELEGAMIAILAQSSINHKEITIDLAKEMIDKYVKSTAREISIEYIQKMVAEHFNIAVETINTSTRRREVAQPRQICMYFAKKYTKLPLSTIGKNCGNKDHATVLHACRVIADLYETDKKMRADIDAIDKKMKL
ncbi:MAG: chromosomal replication initiator protein DnaA [Bacteroidales bacterium]|nr:chromosomal replication initiator protein DnaA [Bacteroidales bacterium]